MRKLTFGMNLSLDGYIAAPGDDLGWSVPSDELFQWWSDRVGATGLALYGRKLWETMSSHWPTADRQPGATPAEIEFARRWRDMPKVVFSSTTSTVDWNTRLVTGDAVTEITRLKTEDGGPIDVGGATLAAAAMRAGLIDEYVLATAPVLVGSGTPFFTALDNWVNLNLVETRTFRRRAPDQVRDQALNTPTSDRRGLRAAQGSRGAVFRGDRYTPAGSQAAYVRDPLGRCGALQSTVGLLDSCGSHVRACARRRRRPVGYGRDVDLQRRIVEREGEFLLFALTPPRRATSPDKAQQIADVTLKRLQALDLDGLVLYDIDDESDRNPEERPFPFLPTMDPAEYLSQYLNDVSMPVVVYRAVGKYGEPDLRSWLGAQDPDRRLSVFVGASSRDKPVATSLVRAHALRIEVKPDLVLGGVAIPERHTRNGDEHLRLLAKQTAGCSFFVSQVVYDINAAKNLGPVLWIMERGRGARS